MPTVCDRCRNEAELQLWFRVYPAQDRVRICADCAEHVRSDAEDRGHDGEDTYRLNGIATALGGDVWRTGETIYWFRFPPGVRSGRNGTNGHGTLMRELRKAGIGFQLARTWDGDQTFERRLKKRKNARRLCPLCNPLATQTETQA